MKVVVINSPLFRNRNELYDEDSLPPIGLGYIATQLQNNGVEVDLIDAVYERIPLEDLIQNIHRIQPAFVAVNIFTTNYELVREFIEGIEIRCHIIIGGLSTKQLWENIIAWQTKNQVDIVTGDGELIVVDIVKNKVKDRPFFKNDTRRVFQVNQQSHYIVNNVSDIPLNRKFFKNEPINHPLGFSEANIVTSRGCVYNCTFCAAARSQNKDYPVRERTEGSIKAELGEIKQQYPFVTSIRVLDDLFLKNKQSVQKATNVFSHFSFQWRSMAHVMTFKDVDEHALLNLQRSGCYELFIGIESGSPGILTSINKTKDVSVIVKNLTKVFKAGINIKGYFIFGFPGETQKDMDATYELAYILKDIASNYNVNFRTSVFQYRPYHATEIYQMLERTGNSLDVTNVAPNVELSNLVGRLQFNFHSGNYSEVDNETVQSYIYRTINLNDGELFSRLKPKTKAM